MRALTYFLLASGAAASQVSCGDSVASAGASPGAASQGGAAGSAQPGGAGAGGNAGTQPSAGATAAGGTSGPSGGAAGGPDATAGAGNATAEGGAAGAGAEGPPQTLELTGAVTHVHDPAVIEEDGKYYLFSTGEGIRVRVSDDLRGWVETGQVFATKPSWITTTAASEPNTLWAPEVAFFGGTYHLYYSASSFGSQKSCIGHATRASLSSGSWQDQGSAVICSKVGDDWNAIDPHPFVDEEGSPWLAFGSFWGGIKMIRLDDDGKRDGPDLFSLSTRANSAVEAPHIVYREGYYYLFESVDFCCQGANSTYKIMVGRSTEVAGPYVDQQGTALLAGGGTLVLSGDQRWKGPGHNAILNAAGRNYNVYHAYDADDGGTPNLRISEMIWTESGWPLSAGP